MSDVAAPGLLRGAWWAVEGRPDTKHRWIAVGTAGCGAAAWASVCFAPDLATQPFAGVCAVAVAVGFAVAAVVVAAQPGRQGAARALGAISAFWPVNTLLGWDVGAMPLVRQLSECVLWVLIPVAVLLYQHPRFGTAERLFVAWISVEFVGGQALWTATSRPEWSGLPATTWWPSIAPDRAAFDLVRDVLAALYAPAALAFAVLLLVRGRRTAPVDRYSLAPVVVATALAGTAAVVSWSIWERTTVGVAVLLLLLPVAFIGAATRLSGLSLRLTRALDVTSPDSGAAPYPRITTALRTVLRDPDLSVAFWSVERAEWVGETGQVRPRPAEPDPDRVEIPVTRADGRLSAVVGTRATSPAARREVEAAVRLAGTVIENAGLHAVIQAQAEAVGRAHARTLRAGVEERRRLEQDLHDGVQQRLLGVLMLLNAPSDPVDRADVDQAGTEVRRALSELRDIAHGLHPAVLTRDGLPGALSDVAARLDLTLDLRIEVGRLDPALETSLYFMVSEALTNVHKHARGARAWVTLVRAAGGLDVEVGDDGVGAADPAGYGLLGLADRAVALGGRCTVHSPVGGGTRLRIWVPCA